MDILALKAYQFWVVKWSWTVIVIMYDHYNECHNEILFETVAFVFACLCPMDCAISALFLLLFFWLVCLPACLFVNFKLVYNFCYIHVWVQYMGTIFIFLGTCTFMWHKCWRACDLDLVTADGLGRAWLVTLALWLQMALAGHGLWPWPFDCRWPWQGRACDLDIVTADDPGRTGFVTLAMWLQMELVGQCLQPWPCDCRWPWQGMACDLDLVTTDGSGRAVFHKHIFFVLRGSSYSSLTALGIWFKLGSNPGPWYWKASSWWDILFTEVVFRHNKAHGNHCTKP